MPFDKFVDIDKIDDDRRKSVMKSIRTINVEELKKLAEEMDAGEGVIFLYTPDVDKGLWYLPGSGMGPLSARARQMMKEAIGKS